MFWQFRGLYLVFKLLVFRAILRVSSNFKRFLRKFAYLLYNMGN